MSTAHGFVVGKCLLVEVHKVATMMTSFEKINKAQAYAQAHVRLSIFNLSFMTIGELMIPPSNVL